MKESSEKRFIQALEICQSLIAFKSQPSNLPFQCIELFCEVAKEPSALLLLTEKYANETKKAFKAVYEYAVTLDNWRLSDEDCPLGFGVKDHCSILSFFLKIQSKKFEFFTGNWTPEKICDLIKDWKGIDLTVLLTNNTPVLVSD